MALGTGDVKIAIVCPYDLDRPGGVQAQVRGLAVALATAGHEAWIVGHGAAADRPTGRIRGVTVNGSVAPLVVAGRPLVLLDDADVVHVHEPLTPLGWRATRTTRPTVVTFHADVPATLRAGLRLLAPVVRRRLSDPVVATAVSSTAARPWELVGLRPRHIPNAIHLPPPELAHPDPARVVFVGRDEPRKGLEVLLRAWRAVHRTRPDAELVIVGSDRDGGPGTRSLGRVSEDVKWAVLAGSSIACAPNLGGESFGIVLVEAMAAGCVLVASDLPAFRAVAGDAATFVPPGDVDALAKALLRLLGDQAARQGLAATGRRRAAAFRWDHVVGSYLAAYEDAVGGVARRERRDRS
jgi:phosphatidyl-myo-inositol alpha-mannosyltransferase